MNKKAILEALKEGGRIILIAILPILYSSINLQSGDINVNWKIIGATIFITFLKIIDKYVHEIGKETDNDKLLTGITRF